MNTQQSVQQADEALRQAVIAFERSVVLVPERPVPALPAFVGVLRAVGGLIRFVIGVALAADRTDPIHLEPRILRTA